MALFLQVIFSGVSQGAIYALIGVGFSLVMLSSRVLNLAHGSFVLYGGFIFLSLAGAFGLPFWILIPLVVLVVAAIGALMERLLNFGMSPWRRPSIDSLVLLTLALLVVFEGVAFVAWGPDPRRAPPLQGGVVEIAGAAIVWQSIWMLVATAFLSAALHLFLHRSWLGLALRACGESDVTVYLLGIDRRAVGLMAFALSAGLGALAGILASPITWIDYQAGGFFMLKGMLAYLIGGEKVAGPLVGGILLGLTENLLLLLPGTAGGLLKQVVPMLALLVILLVRPRGILPIHRVRSHGILPIRQTSA